MPVRYTWESCFFFATHLHDYNFWTYSKSRFEIEKKKEKGESSPFNEILSLFPLLIAINRIKPGCIIHCFPPLSPPPSFFSFSYIIGAEFIFANFLIIRTAVVMDFETSRAPNDQS